ncbi:MAG TPA: prepilin-type N-terminal cleavage/methylation domain-containing protein [Syntrophales bacterium]|jgi:prepilin-type N-terminal cleavage/methylation domain-containing protein|nr:prepilin-type N-terminal cleavage/methylation domain-containing protein [Syntrophales bacterium]HPX56387.1 prepilin-type N-terminal cleavage/methylation domain-containing protein [Syntrophales bacterium]HQA83239.1 prepilin-type N-terminal cleavage/methylation domain-containing protein [Syntrophales bacterium]
MKSQRGVTLVELIIAMAVTTLVLGSVYLAVNSTQRHSAAIEGKVVAQQDVKAALDLMALEISMASYNPGFASDIWRTANDCNTAGVNEYRGIQEATANALTVEMDLDGDGDTTGTNEKIRYSYIATADGDRYIARAVGCGGGFTAFLGDKLADGRPLNVRVVNGDYNPVIPVFRYFNGSGTEIPVDGTADGLPAKTADIRRIVITLAVETEHIDPNTGQRKRLIYSISVIPRNHVISQ